MAMMYLVQNSREYDYDVRAIALAFLPGEKIVEVTEKELGDLEAFPRDHIVSSKVLRLDYGDRCIRGSLSGTSGPGVTGEIHCDYKDHPASRNKVCRFIYRLFSDYTGRTLPWGTLTGVRPTKIMMKWMEEETDPDRLEDRFTQTYLADRQKARLCRRVALKEKEILGSRDYAKEYSLYIGIPFCPTTCLYCSFTSFPVTRFGHQMEPYLEALDKELAFVAQTAGGRKLTSVYIGGGTPTALDEKSLSFLLDRVRDSFPISDAEEFTVEAGRPDSVNEDKLKILKEAGVSRISINPQTMHQETLDLIGRKHTIEQTIRAFELARAAGFDNINMDIITGLPGEKLPHVEQTLREVFALNPESLTVHSLAIKRAAGLNIDLDSYRDLVYGTTNEMLKTVDRYAGDMGMEAYYMYRQKNIPGNLENIGYSRPGKECLYNILIMEEKQDILSCGAGASTKLYYPEEDRIERIENVKSLEHYIARIDEMIERKHILRENRKGGSR